MCFRRGSYRVLPTLPRPLSWATLLQEGEYPRSDCKHYPEPLRDHPFFSASNLDRSVVLISGNGII